MTDHEIPHGGHLVPIKRDRDGTILILCFFDSEIGTVADGYALYCPACRTAVTPILAATVGLHDLDGLPDHLADALYRQEARLSQEHAAAMTGQPEPVTFRTTVGESR